MSLFAGAAPPASTAMLGAAMVEVPGFYLDAGAGALAPLEAPAPKIPTPADDNIQPAEGDDTTAPNATSATRLNRVVCVASANVGYSKAAKETHVQPCALEYDATVEETMRPGEFALVLKMTLEYESAFPEEGMVVWLKKHQQFINDDKTCELQLIETAFEDYAQGRWVPITTDIRYAEEAEAIVQAVITSDSGQTAGRVSTEGAVEDAKLGPVGERGRIVLTYRCEQLYSYAEMALGASASGKSLVPLALQLPWAALDNPANNCRVCAQVRAPAGTELLSPEVNILAYRDLQQSLRAAAQSSSQCAVLPAPSAGGGVAAWSFSRTSLPPRPTMILAWLSIPSIDDSWEHVEEALPRATRVRLMAPSGDSAPFLRVQQPGGFPAHVIRCQVDTEAPQRSPDSRRVHVDITISDSSGSTRMRCSMGGKSHTVRECFNMHEERRVLKRLEGIPRLRRAGLLLDADVWIQEFVIFDHTAKSHFTIEARVGDLDEETVAHLLQALAGDGSAAATAAAALERAGKQALLTSWRDALKTLRGIAPSGATSFVAGARKAKESYVQNIRRRFPGAEFTSYVNFDTDGGNNCGPCYDAIRALVREADVVQGHVLGVGSWVDQDCAAKVAKLLKGSASLALSFPEDAAADDLFRQDLSRWVKALRSCPVTVKISAGSVQWSARHGARLENGADCLCAEGEGVKFEQPDVSEMDHTKAVLTGLQAGTSATLYLLSRLPLEQLVSALNVEVGGVRAQVSLGAERQTGVALGYRWLSVLGAEALPDGVAANRAVLCSRLRQRLEDDLSFAWNLPTKSGSTAAVGRARTQQRPPVPAEQQPEEPAAPALQSAAQPSKLDLLCFGAAGGAPPPQRGVTLGCAPPMSPPMAGGFGGGGPRGGGKGGAPTAPMMLQQCMARSSVPPFAAPPAAAGAPARRDAAERKCKKRVAPSGRRSMFSRIASECDDDMDELMAPKDGAPTPGRLLASSGHMQLGAREAPRDALARGVAALRVLANGALRGLSASAAAGAAPSAEDPLVGDILGAVPSAAAGGGSLLPRQPLKRSPVHTGFVCDASGREPITGMRFKATDHFDLDVTEVCRRAGNLAGGGGFRPIPTPDAAMVWALSAVLAWWRIVWRRREDLFQSAAVDLKSLGTSALCQAILNLPEGVDATDLP